MVTPESVLVAEGKGVLGRGTAFTHTLTHDCAWCPGKRCGIRWPEREAEVRSGRVAVAVRKAHGLPQFNPSAVTNAFLGKVIP